MSFPLGSEAKFLGTAMTTIEYMLQPSDDLVQLSDEFTARGCRVRLAGATLSIECRSDRRTECVALAQDYAAELRHQFPLVRLLSMEQFAALPARSVTVQGKSTRDLSLDRRRLRDARRAIVSKDNLRLSQCYDYLQLAREEPERASFHIYKMVEVIEAGYGGETSAARALDEGGLIKKLKRQANEAQYDQRHASLEPAAVTPLNAEAVAKYLVDAHTLLRKYEEDSVLRKGSS